MRDRWWMLVKVALILGVSYVANRVLRADHPAEGEYPGDCPKCGKPRHLDPGHFEGYGCRDCAGAREP